MKKSIFIGIIIILACILCGALFFYDKDDKQILTNEINDKIEDQKQELTKSDDIENNQVIESEEPTIEAPKQETQKTENKTTTNVIKEQTGSNKVSTSEKTSDKQQTINNKVQDHEIDNTPKKETEVKQSAPIVESKTEQLWDIMGITEDEYYNSPMWKWATIDFEITKYGTREATEIACQNKGKEYIEKGEAYGFSCTPINSYSGKYLGEMLKLQST